MADRKRGRDHAPDNVDAKGDYVVGKNRPPESGKFRAGDGRPRGQRKKGTRRPLVEGFCAFRLID